MAISRLQQSRQMRRGGGIMGSNAGSMLVAPTADGTRPGYYGPDEGHAGEMGSKGFGSGYSGGSLGGGGEGISNAGAKRALTNNASLRAALMNNAAEEKAKAEGIAARAFQEKIAAEAAKGKTPAAYSYGKKINPYDFSKRPRGPVGFMDAGMMVAKDLYTKYQNNRIRNLMMKGDIEIDPVTGKYVQSVDEFGNIINPGQGKMEKKIQTIPIDEPDSGFFKSRVKDFGGDGDGPPILLPINYNTGAGTTEDVDVEEDVTYDWHLGKGGQKTGRDVTLGYLASGGRARRAEGGIMGLRARKAFGGIMDRVTGRKAYGLGSIFKSVKKAVGKVLKSPIGKAAVLYAGGSYLSGAGMFGSLPGAGAFSKEGFLAPLLRKKLEGDAGYGGINWWKAAGLAGVAAPFIPGPWNKVKPNESLGMTKRGGHLIDPITGKEALPNQMRASLENALNTADGDPQKIAAIKAAYPFYGIDERLGSYVPYRNYSVANGGRIGKAEGGLMDLGGMEKDYRAEGGFVPIGAKEKADDVPARLSVNEFVFTADAVRNAGGGDIDQGAEVMENVMKNLEAGGKISAETQGNTGAQEMFSVSERLGEVI